MPRICSKCNQEVDEKAKFCSNCGCGQIIDLNVAAANTTTALGSAPAPSNLVASPNPSVANANVETAAPVMETTPVAVAQPVMTPMNTTPVVTASAPAQVNAGVVEFPVGQQTTETASQLQSMPEIPNSNPVVTTTPNMMGMPVQNSMQAPMMMPGAVPNNGVIDNNSFGGAVRQKHKKHGSNNNIIWVVMGAGGILILLLLVLVIILLVSNKYGGNTQNPGNGNDSDTIRIGSGAFGYLTIPKTWNVFIDQNTIQYTDGAGWIVTLFATSNSVIASKNWATNVANQMQNDGAQDVAMAEDSVNNYHGYKVFGYYESSNTFLAAWFFEAEDGNTHYVAIEGPNRYDDNYDIIYTFSLKQ